MTRKWTSHDKGMPHVRLAFTVGYILTSLLSYCIPEFNVIYLFCDDVFGQMETFSLTPLNRINVRNPF